MWYICFLLTWAIMAPATMVAANTSGPVHRVTSVVRSDARTGHLIRTIVVSPKIVAPASIPQAAPASSVEALNLNALVEETARAYDLDPALVHSIIKVESNYNPNAVSNKGAQGLMQLIPATARRMGVKNTFDPKENIEAGVRYYKYLKTIFRDDRLALAAYNAGEGAVARYNFNIPPYPETLNYVYRVGKNWGDAARRRQAQPRQEKAAAAAVPPPPETAPIEHPKLEQYRDDQGRIYIKTVSQ
jgi:soluble lytic murein transglycosylase-like protein